MTGCSHSSTPMLYPYPSPRPLLRPPPPQALQPAFTRLKDTLQQLKKNLPTSRPRAGGGPAAPPRAATRKPKATLIELVLDVRCCTTCCDVLQHTEHIYVLHCASWVLYFILLCGSYNIMMDICNVL